MTQFKLLGFSQHGDVRQFLFQRDDAGDRTVCTVNADLALARKFKLAVQDLPLLCTRLLQTEADAHPVKSLALSEAQMRIHSLENQELQKLDAEKSALRSRRSALAAEARSGAADTAAGKTAVTPETGSSPQLLGGH
jgi:hypothetical protein